MPSLQLAGVVLLCGLALPAALASAEEPRGYFSGAEILQSCTEPVKPLAARSTQELLDAGVCAGFVGAVADTMKCESPGIAGERAAVPADVGLLELALVVEKWLGDHAGDLHKAGAPLVARALAERWPCSK